MQIHELFREAWAETEKAELPEYIHEVAFTHAVALLGGAPQTPSIATTVPVASPLAPSPTPTASSPSSHPSDAPSMSTDDLFDEFASETGVDRDKLESVFYFHEGEPGISLRVHKLGRNKAEQARTVALLLFCVHYFALNANELSVEAVRAVCEKLNCYDSPNFSSALAKIEGVNYTGPKGKKVLRFRPNTVDKFRHKITSIVGEGA